VVSRLERGETWPTGVESLGQDYYKRLESQFTSALNGERVRFETYNTFPDGKLRYLDIEYVPDASADGRVKGYYSVIHDISERKKVEEALREREQMLRRIFESAAIGITATDKDGRYIQFNPAFQKLLGLTAKELSAKAFWDITNKYDHHLEVRPFNDLVAGRIDSYQCYKRYLHKDGSIIWVNLNVANLKDADGEAIGSIATVEDITARKLNDQAQKLSESRLAEAQQLARIGSWEQNFITGISV